MARDKAEMSKVAALTRTQTRYAVVVGLMYVRVRTVYLAITGTVTVLTVFVNLLNDLLQRGRFDFESHHGENVADVVCRDRSLLVGKAVEASL